jgi:hypothetical protein
MKMLKFALFLLFISAVSAANGQTISAASCSASDVQAAFNSVTGSTTTVLIPAGSCTWTTQVSLNVPSGSASLSVLGAGNLNTLGGGDQTSITDNDSAGQSLLQVSTNSTASSKFRLAGLTFKAGSGATKYAVVTVTGGSQNVRIDHNHWSYSSSSGSSLLKTSGWVYGVVDHNLFDMGGSTQGVWTWDEGYGGNSYGDGAWAAATQLGSANFVFVEDNTFNGALYANDCTEGGRQVFRHNTVNNSIGIQTHPTGGGGRVRGCRAWEVYGNTFSGSNSSPFYNAFFLSSGTGVIWGNSATTGYETFASLHNVRSDNSDYSQSSTPGGWGYCGTSFNGTGSSWDGNTSGASGYPCLDQPARGKGDLISGDFPNVKNTATGSIAWTHEALEPIYEWMDNWVQVPGYGYSFFNVHEPEVLVQNVDFYGWCHSGSSTGCTNFTGVSTPASSTNGGVGSGLLSARPSSCTPTVAYWATDTNTLYQCLTTNNWTAYYTPYAYPHPLVSGQQGATAPPPPTNVQSTVQ